MLAWACHGKFCLFWTFLLMASPAWPPPPAHVTETPHPVRAERGECWLPREDLCRKLMTEADAAAIVMLAGPKGIGKSATLRALGDWIDVSGLPLLRVNAADFDTLPAHLADLPPETLIIVDGLKRLPAGAAYDALAQDLVALAQARRAIGGCGIFVSDAGPRAPAFRAAWREGALRVFGLRAMAFSAEDCARLLGLPDAAVEGRLAQRLVVGWPLGIKLLAQDLPRTLALLGHAGDKQSLPEALQAWFDDIAWQSFTPPLRKLLMDLSILGRFAPELAATFVAQHETAGQEELSQAFRALMQEGFYLQDCPDRSGWLQLMPAFARYLAAKLRLSDPARVEQVHGIAVSWAIQAGETAEIQRHAQQMTPSPAVTALVEASGEITVSFDIGPDLYLVQPLRPDRARDAPMVFFAQIYDRIRHGGEAEARIHYEAAAALTEGFTRFSVPQDDIAIDGWRIIFEFIFDLARDVDIAPERIAALDSKLKSLLGNHMVLAASIATVLALLQLDRGDLAETMRICRLGISLHRQLRAHKATLFLHQHYSSAALATGSLVTALEESEAATRLAVIEGDAESYEIRTSALHYGLCLFEAGDLARASGLIAPVLPHLQSIHGWLRLYAESFAAMMSIGLVEQGPSGAAYWLDQGRTLAQIQRWPRLERLLDATAIRLGVEEPSSAQIDSFTAAYRACPASALALAAIRMAAGDLAGAEAVLAAWPDAKLLEGDRRLLLQARLLTLELAQRRGDAAAAQKGLAAWLDLAKRSGYVQRLREAGPRIAAVERWLAQTPSEAEPQDIVPLSPREAEIMAFVAAGLVNKEIARKLGISEGTVKSHRKNLYEKMGVTSRSEAIAKARDLGLI